MNASKAYIGDGVYASDDGFHIVLDTGESRIFLESECLTGLFRYIEKARNVKIYVERLQPKEATNE